MIPALLLMAALPVSDWQPLFETLPAKVRGWRSGQGDIRTVPSLVTEDLFAGLRYRDFEFEVEYKVAPGGNSGIRYLPLPGRRAGLGRAAAFFVALCLAVLLLLRRRRRTALLASAVLLAGFGGVLLWLKWHPLALEFQILDNAGHRDGKRGPLYRAGALYGLCPAAEDASRPAGEWNQARVVICGARIEHWLNGRKVVDCDMSTRQHRLARERFFGSGWRLLYSRAEWERLGLDRPSTVGLQHHGEQVWFRRARIRELSCQ